MIAPELFVELGRRWKELGRVERWLKSGRYDNELSRFRYDVVLKYNEKGGKTTPSLYFGPSTKQARAFYQLEWGRSMTNSSSLAEATGLCPSPITRVELLGSDMPISWARDATGLRVALPLVKPCEHAGVLKIMA